jgi:tRNA(Met) C34 N-acetyltransferase TmcA
MNEKDDHSSDGRCSHFRRSPLSLMHMLIAPTQSLFQFTTGQPDRDVNVVGQILEQQGHSLNM